MHCRCPLLFVLLTVVVLQNTASAQSLPLPQPGVGIDPSVPSASDLGGTRTRTLDTNHATITASGTSPSLTSQPSILTTTINGTPTTLTTMAAASPAYQQPILGPNSIPKAPQSLLVIQSTTYGKVLPAVVPTDDRIDSHFWYQFVPPSQGGQRSSASCTWPSFALPVSSLLSLWWHVVENVCLSLGEIGGRH
jgi:hypothetical protein